MGGSSNLSTVSRSTTKSIRVVGAAQLDYLTGGLVLHHAIAGDVVGVFKTDFLAGR